MPRKLRLIWIFAASLYFYSKVSLVTIIFPLIIAFITWFLSLAIERNSCDDQKDRKAKILTILALLIDFGILCIFKYANFILATFDKILAISGIGDFDYRLDIIVPIGISFYTFSTAAYIIDVYRGKIKAEKNLFFYACYVLFFPYIVMGPVERAGHILPQLHSYKDENLFDYDRVMNGFCTALLGLFMKMVIADRAAIFVDTVYESYSSYGSIELFLASVLYSIEIYCDFAGYSLIAIGCAKVMGIDLVENFNVPYGAQSVKEFWRRWHMSLSSWLRDYVYIPLGGNRCSKVRRHINILITFLVCGIWHGAWWNFLFWRY